MAVGRRILPAAQAQIVDSAGRSTPQFYDFFRRLLDELAELRRAVEQLQGIHPPAVPDLSQYTRRGANESITGQWSFYDSIWGADGSEPEPQYTFINDPDLGFYRVDDDNLGISVGGVLRWDIDDTRTFQSVMLQARVADGYIARFENETDPEAGLRIYTEYGPLGTDTYLDFYETMTKYFRLGNRGNPEDNAFFELTRVGSDSRIDGTVISVARETRGVTFYERLLVPDGSSTAPAIAFLNESPMGFYRAGTDDFRATMGGGIGDRMIWGASDVSVVQVPFRVISGSAASPGFGFNADTDTGIYLPSTGQIGFTTGGTQRFRIETTEMVATLPLRGPDGTATAPAFSFSADTNVGMYLVGTDQLGFATGGTLRLTIDGSTSITSTLPLRGPNGSAAAPAVSFSVDSDTGIYRAGENQLAAAEGGVQTMRFAFANPSALIGLTPVNGTSLQPMRSDAAPALDQGISPTWTGEHIFTMPTTFIDDVLISGDNLELQIGEDADLRIYHDGTDSVVRSDTGLLRLNSGDTSALAISTSAAEFRARPYINLDDVSSVPAEAIAGDADFLIAANTNATSIELIAANGGSNGFRFISASGGFGSLAAINTASNTYLGYLGVGGYDGTSWAVPSAGLIGLKPAGDWSSSSHPTLIVFETTAIGSTTRNVRVRINDTGTMQITDGDASLPGLAFLQDSNSGLARLADDHLALVTGGVARVSVNAAGRVGIGRIDYTGGFPLLVSSSGAGILIEDTDTSDSGRPFGFIRSVNGSFQIGQANRSGSSTTSSAVRLSLKAGGQVRFMPLPSDPDGGEDGDVYYNSSTNKLRLYAGGSWGDLN